MAQQLANGAFGVTEVVNVHVYAGPNCQDLNNWKSMKPSEIYAAVTGTTEEAFIDHLTMFTTSMEGPTTEIKGGLYNNTLVKSGKTGRAEMTDALADMNAFVALGLLEKSTDGSDVDSYSVTQNFGAVKCLTGDTCVMQRGTGKMVPVHIIVYQFLPDSIPSFAFEAGNAGTIDMSGDMLCTDVKIGTGTVGTFWSIIDNGDEINVDDACSASPIYPPVNG